jgi:hypothetical protein
MPARLQLHIQEPLELQIPNSSKASFGQLLRMLFPARAGALHAKPVFMAPYAYTNGSGSMLSWPEAFLCTKLFGATPSEAMRGGWGEEPNSS